MSTSVRSSALDPDSLDGSKRAAIAEVDATSELYVLYIHSIDGHIWSLISMG